MPVRRAGQTDPRDENIRDPVRQTAAEDDRGGVERVAEDRTERRERRYGASTVPGGDRR